MENGVPEVLDGQVQLTEGTLDLAGHPGIADQRERVLQIQSRREQPPGHDVVALGNLFMIFGC
jgi:hypothetical protein